MLLSDFLWGSLQQRKNWPGNSWAFTYTIHGSSTQAPTFELSFPAFKICLLTKIDLLGLFVVS